MSKPFSIALPRRGLVHIEGEDRKSFLQGLVSNDMEKVSPGKITYACLLTPQGKFLHDFFIHEGDNFLLLDCEGGARAQDLHDRLNKFRLRAKVKLSVEENHPVYAILPSSHTGLDPGSTDPDLRLDAKIDPRDSRLGHRTFQKPPCEEKAFEEWDRLRISLTIPDGSRDMQPERATLLESHIDKLNGIDWQKGCYMGQELTARLHYRGLAKKHIHTVKIDGAAPAPFSDLPNGGTMLSSCGDLGLALLKDEKLHETDYGTVKPL
ncbi:MAG TPA: folate-binding protein [Micavibrio sp.]|nr:folate-binding protein [Micavibrio sp.]